ncbi:hypothetical protein ALC56_13478, partial [Trachymyrmex septentrionalis]
RAPLRLARRLYSVNCFIFNPDALVSNKQTLYHISAAQISLNTISNGHLTFMKMTGDGSPPESSSYDGRECDRGKKGNHRRESTEWEGQPVGIWRGERGDVTKCRGTAYRYAMGGNLATIYDQPRH